MTGEKVLEVVGHYADQLCDYEPERTQDPVRWQPHVLWMIVQIRGFVAAGRMDKAFRWLGFVQGVLFCKGEYKVEELKNHNRPNEENPT